MVGYTTATATPLVTLQTDISTTTNIDVLVVIVSTKCIDLDNNNPDPYIDDTFESTLTLCNNNIKVIRLLVCYNHQHDLNLFIIDQLIPYIIQQTGMAQEKVTVVVEEW
jgi:hypothetical protein